MPREFFGVGKSSSTCATNSYALHAWCLGGAVFCLSFPLTGPRNPIFLDTGNLPSPLTLRTEGGHFPHKDHYRLGKDDILWPWQSDLGVHFPEGFNGFPANEPKDDKRREIIRPSQTQQVFCQETTEQGNGHEKAGG